METTNTKSKNLGNLLTDVSWIIYNSDDVKTIDISPNTFRKDEFLKCLSEDAFAIPDTNPGEELCLQYYNGPQLVSISIRNYTSDVESEWYSYRTSDTVILESAKADKEYVYDYTDKKMRAEVAGSELTFEEFLKTIS